MVDVTVTPIVSASFVSSLSTNLCSTILLAMQYGAVEFYALEHT